jgi:hypothetical protein
MGNDENRSGLRLGNPLVAGSRLAPFFAAAAADWRATVLLAEPAANCQPVLRLACDHTLCAIMNDLHVCELSHSKRADQGLSPTAETRWLLG